MSIISLEQFPHPHHVIATARWIFTHIWRTWTKSLSKVDTPSFYINFLTIQGRETKKGIKLFATSMQPISVSFKIYKTFLYQLYSTPYIIYMICKTGCLDSWNHASLLLLLFIRSFITCAIYSKHLSKWVLNRLPMWVKRMVITYDRKLVCNLDSRNFLTPNLLRHLTHLWEFHMLYIMFSWVTLWFVVNASLSLHVTSNFVLLYSICLIIYLETFNNYNIF